MLIVLFLDEKKKINSIFCIFPRMKNLHTKKACNRSTVKPVLSGHRVKRTPSIKVAEHSFGSLWVNVICQIMARERLQLTSWNLASEKYTDERSWLTGKIWRFVVSMATWTIEYNLKISILLSLHKIRSLDFPINLQTAYYN